MDDDYIFRRELDLQTNIPEMIVHLKNDRPFRKMDVTKKKELFDEFYTLVEKNYHLKDISDEEKRKIEKSAMEQFLERARQEVRKNMH